ncbi:hypothetical protein EDB89DRAFT_1954591 [Lactarius sanguifluus]|nr:hypothetical protein EDB89DRAFT_1954591 [Lactarius sanguifluus]
MRFNLRPECSESSGSVSRTSVACWTPLWYPVTPEPSCLEPFLPTVILTTEDAEASAAAATADVDLLRGSADEPGTFMPPDGTLSTTGGRTMGDAASASAVLQEELAAQLAHVAGQLRRNAEHFSRRAGGEPEGVRRVAEEKVGANHEVMRQERERLCDRRWKALGTTCLAISNVFIAIAVLVMFGSHERR